MQHALLHNSMAQCQPNLGRLADSCHFFKLHFPLSNMLWLGLIPLRIPVSIPIG